MELSVIEGRGKLTAQASASSLGATIRVTTAPNTQPVWWAKISIGVDQLRQLTEEAEAARDALPDLTATSQLIPLEAEESQQAHFDRLEIAGIDLREEAKKLEEQLNENLNK